nr:hypothetical protein [Tanacetum cinerariifolium]
MHKNLFYVSMESLSPQVVSAAKLPILNPNEFDLWKMRIEQVIDGVVHPVAPTTTEQRLAKKNELKAHEKRFGGNKKTKKVEVKSSSSASTSTQNIAFVSSQNTDNTNESVSVVANVFIASATVPVFALPNEDTLSDVVIYSLFSSYANQVFNSSVFDCDEMFSSESDISMPASPIYNRYQSGEGYHVVSPPYTGTFMPLKLDLVFPDAATVNETVPTAFNVEPSTTKPT